MKCFDCQIKTIADADVLIGVHGAGLGNMVYNNNK
jgi:capsular polysaccharide biosynthesis protein